MTNSVPEKVAKCKTHHHGCDCREYKYKKMEEALIAIMKHQEISGGNMHKLSVTWNIAKNVISCLDDNAQNHQLAG